MDLKPLAKSLLERSINLALACGLSPSEVVGSVHRVRNDCGLEFAFSMEARPRPIEVIDLTCACAESVVLLLVAIRPTPDPKDFSR